MRNMTSRLTIALGCCLGLLIVAGCYEETPLQADMYSELENGELISGHAMVPFRGEYDETFETVSFEFPFNNIELSGTGHATHLGNSTFFGAVQINVITGVETGTIDFTAADGATFSTTIVGIALVDGNDISFSGEWTVTGGTGRFKNITGSGAFDGTGTLDPAVGQINFDGEISKPTGAKAEMSL